MARERASLGFGGELDDFDPAAWTRPDAPAVPKPRPVGTREAAEAAGFRSREPATTAAATPAPVTAPVPMPVAEPAAKQRRRRTGRNVQFNIKARPETIEAFCRIADAKGWGLGETFEIATELLAKAHGEG